MSWLSCVARAKRMPRGLSHFSTLLSRLGRGCFRSRQGTAALSRVCPDAQILKSWQSRRGFPRLSPVQNHCQAAVQEFLLSCDPGQGLSCTHQHLEAREILRDGSVAGKGRNLQPHGFAGFPYKLVDRHLPAGRGVYRRGSLGGPVTWIE